MSGYRVCLWCGAGFYDSNKLGEHWAQQHKGKPVEQPVEKKKRKKKV